jgi:hypothetical protein
VRLRLACIALSVAVVGLVALWVLEPRLHHTFPSMIDDWSAISNAPDQLRTVLTLGNPERGRYRPGFIAWNALQWHTLGAPQSFVGPQLWNGFRVLTLIVGLVLLAGLLTRGGGGAEATPRFTRCLLITSVPLSIVTMPALAVDLARFGPQEPLLVGCMCVGSVLLVVALDRVLAQWKSSLSTAGLAAVGLAFWTFGVLQKETSLSLLVLAPFLFPTACSQRRRWERLDRRRRLAVGFLGGATLLPFVPVLVGTIQLVVAADLVYDARVEPGRGLIRDMWTQLAQADDTLSTPVVSLMSLGAVVTVTLVCVARSVDWISIGLLAAALVTMTFAAESGVVTSRYYIPGVALAALALVRSASELGRRVALLMAVGLVALGCVQAPFARERVGSWADDERFQETVVREAAGRMSGGCRVDLTGRNTELVAALPVLVPLTDEKPHDCAEGERFVVVIDGGVPGEPTSDEDPVLGDCRPKEEVAKVGSLARIMLCSAY